MRIEVSNYPISAYYKSPGACIRRYYLPTCFWNNLQDPDMEALFWKVYGNKNDKDALKKMAAEPCRIYYKEQGLVKEIAINVLEPAIDACTRYISDRYDKNLTEEETEILVALNERLYGIEREMRAEYYRIYCELQARRDRCEPFPDFEMEATVWFYLHEDHPLSQEDDENFIHRSRGLINLEDFFQGDAAELDYNERKESTNPLIRNSSLYSIPHCLIFIDLESHSGVPLNLLCGIGLIWANIEVHHQSYINVERFSSKVMLRV